MITKKEFFENLSFDQGVPVYIYTGDIWEAWRDEKNEGDVKIPRWWLRRFEANFFPSFEDLAVKFPREMKECIQQNQKNK